MSLTSDRSTISRLNKDIADLRGKEAGEAKKAADAQKRQSSASASASRTSSASLAKSYLSTAEREGKALQAALDSQSRYASQAAAKTQEAARIQQRILQEEENERRKAAASETRRRREESADREAEAAVRRRVDKANADTARALQQRIDDLEALLTEQLEARASATPAFSPAIPEGEEEAYDVFISHAWEDKEDFVQHLAERCREAGLRVWYDQFALEWGDSIRQKIDAGLASSYFGIAVLSPSFFAKAWTQYELDGLLERAANGAGRLLPVWHKLSKDEVAKHAPSLAGRLALNTSFMSADEIAQELKRLRDRYAANV